MASLWEILEPSNLSYDTQLGFTQDDSGSSPPNAVEGWIRTGHFANSAGLAGDSNCNAYMSAEPQDFGTIVFLGRDWNASATIISPWIAGGHPCNSPFRVWCVQD